MAFDRTVATLAAACVCAALVTTPAGAGIEKAGTTSANFLSIGTGARALGMGGATLGLAGDLNAASWNPGALGMMNGLELTFSHAALADQSAQEWMTAGGRFGHAPLRWALSGVFQSEGSFDGRDASNQSTGSFDVSSLAVGGQLASSFGEHVSAGVGFKWAHENLGPGVTGDGVTFDGGLLLRAGGFGLGLAAQNLGGEMKFDGQGYPFPSNIGVGVSYEHQSGLRAALDYNAPSAYYSDVRGGLEWRWREFVALRAGYRMELGAAAEDPLGGPSFGVGAGAAGMWFDYGYVLAANGEGRHRMALTFSPSRLGWGHGSLAKDDKPRDREKMMRIGPPASEEKKGE